MMLFRESLFLLTYLLFLINTVVGLVVAIWRIVITALYNIIHLGRIDVSLLHRTAETYDPGTIHSICLEQWNPGVLRNRLYRPLWTHPLCTVTLLLILIILNDLMIITKVWNCIFQTVWFKFYSVTFNSI